MQRGNGTRLSYLLVRELERALRGSMVTRANGSVHHRSCYNASVNAAWYPCSERCLEAQRVLQEARVWLESNRPVIPKMKVPGG